MSGREEKGMEVYEVLEKALGLIEREENWCGDNLSGRGPNGSQCAAIALSTAAGSPTHTDTPGFAVYFDAWKLLSAMVGRPLPQFNDSHSHAEVVALFQEAIRNEKHKAGIPLYVPDSHSAQSKFPECSEEATV